MRFSQEKPYHPSDRRRQSLQHKIMAFMATLALTAILAAAASTIYSVYRTEQTGWKGRQLEAAHSAADKVSTFLTHAQDLLGDVGLLDDDYLQAKPQILHRLLEDNPAFLELIRLDAKNRILASYYRDAPLLANQFTIPQSNWFIQAAAGKKYLGEPQISSDNKPYLILAIPAPDGGVVVARLSMEALWQTVASIRFGQNGQAYVIDHNQKIIAYSNPQVVLSGMDLPVNPGLVALSSSSATHWYGSYVDSKGNKELGAIAPVAGTTWYVVTELPQQEAYASSRTALLILSIEMAILGALAIWVARRFLSRQIFKPIEKLRAGAERIGQGDLNHRIEVVQRDEIGQVVEVFNDMAVHLSERQRQLSEHAAKLDTEVTDRRRAEQALQFAKDMLEIQVQERTADLSEANKRLEMDITERKQIEAAVRDAEAKFRTLVEQIPAITYIASLDDQRPTIYISPQVKPILGFTQEEWIADPDLWSNQIHPDDREFVSVADESSHDTGEPFTSEYRILARDGHVVWLHDESRWVYDEGGKPRFTQGIEFDITERKQSELLQEVVYQIAKATNQELSLNELAKTIHRSIQEVMMADNFYIALHDAKTDMINYLYVVDQYDDEISLAKSGKSMTAYVLRSGESLLAKEAIYQELLKAGEVELVGTPSPVWLGIPLKIQGKAIGVMVVQDYQNERVYGEREKQLLEYVSSQVAISIQRKQAEAAAREAEAKYRALVERIPAAVYIWELGDNGACRYISPQVEAMLGFSVEEWLSDPGLFFRQVHPEDREHTIAAEEHSQASGEGLRSEFRMLTRDGRVVWMRDESVTLPAEEGGVRSNQGLLFDITERKEAEILQQVVYEIAQATNQELSLNELFATIHKSIQKVMIADNFYIAVYDPKTDILSFPYSVDQIEKDFFPAKLGKGMTELVLRTGQSLLSTPAVHQKLMETGEIEAVGAPSRIWLGVPLRIHGKTIGAMAVQDYYNETAYGQTEKQILEYVSSQVAMSIQRKQSEERLAHDALHDGLTGLPNRTLFLDRLEHAIRKIERSVEDKFAVLFLDIDRFKLINDSLGHACGDQLLIEIGERLKTCLRPADTVARLAGDEFVVLLEDMIDAADATHIASRIQSELSSPFHLEGHQLIITVSIGIAMSSPEYDQAQDLLRDADTAMYRAKTTGKARHEIFDTGMHAAVSSLLELEADLRQAIEKQEFQVYYQPLVSMSSGGIVGTEALLRWQHPARGLLPPAAFITVLEETGMIIPAGEWILRAACFQNKAWQARGYPHLRVAVNFSARQFHIKNLAEMVKSVLNETGMDPATLELEITESTAMKDVDLTLRTLNELRALGVGISLDDFGSGYSALGYLSRYPFHSLKADRSFILDIPNDSNDMAITSAIIAMAHSLKLRVVAEGVETVEQLEFLRSNNCDEVQGFLFSRPVPAQELSGLLPKQNLLPVSKTKGKKEKKRGIV